MPFDPALLLPFEHRIAGQLDSVVADHHTGIAAMLGNGIQFAGDTLA